MRTPIIGDYLISVAGVIKNTNKAGLLLPAFCKIALMKDKRPDYLITNQFMHDLKRLIQVLQY